MYHTDTFGQLLVSVDSSWLSEWRKIGVKLKKKKRILRNATKKIAVNNSVLTPLHTSREVNIRIKTFEF